MYSTIDDPSTASPDNLALSFAIYFAATASLDGPEAQVVLEQDKHKLLLRFKVGLEQAFAYGDFLDRPTLTALHALAIYLVCTIFIAHLFQFPDEPKLSLVDASRP